MFLTLLNLDVSVCEVMKTLMKISSKYPWGDVCPLQGFKQYRPVMISGHTFTFFIRQRVTPTHCALPSIPYMKELSL